MKNITTALKTSERNLSQLMVYSIQDLNEGFTDPNYYLEIRMYKDKKSFKSIIRLDGSDKSYGSNSVCEHPFVITDDSEYTTTNYHQRPTRIGLGTIVDLLEELKKPKVVKDNVIENPIDVALRNLVDAVLQQPSNELIGNLNYIIDNLNELGTDYTITLKTK